MDRCNVSSWANQSVFKKKKGGHRGVSHDARHDCAGLAVLSVVPVRRGPHASSRESIRIRREVGSAFGCLLVLLPSAPPRKTYSARTGTNRNVRTMFAGSPRHDGGTLTRGIPGFLLLLSTAHACVGTATSTPIRVYSLPHTRHNDRKRLTITGAGVRGAPAHQGRRLRGRREPRKDRAL